MEDEYVWHIKQTEDKIKYVCLINNIHLYYGELDHETLKYGILSSNKNIIEIISDNLNDLYNYILGNGFEFNITVNGSYLKDCLKLYETIDGKYLIVSKIEQKDLKRNLILSYDIDNGEVFFSYFKCKYEPIKINENSCIFKYNDEILDEFNNLFNLNT